MLLEISNRTRMVLTNIHVFLSNVNSENNGNDFERNQKDYIFAMRYERNIDENVNLFLVNNINKYIKSLYF